MSALPRPYTEEYLRFSTISQTYQAVLFGIVLWDWLVCGQSEYRNIWKASASLSKYLYLVSRYLCLLLTAAVFALHFIQRPLEQCDILVRLNCAALTVVQMTSTATLTQRAYVMTHRSKVVLCALLPFIMATAVLGVLHAVFAIAADESAMFAGKGYCHVASRSGAAALSGAFFAVPIIANTIATGIVLHRAVKHLSRSSDLRNLLLVDGLLFLIGVDTVGMVQLLFFIETVNGMLMMLNAAALLALTSVFCCRLILHLRESSEAITESSAARIVDVDWSKSFGRPIEAPSSASSRETLWRKARPTKSSNGRTSVYETRNFEDLPDFVIDLPREEKESPHLPISISLEVHQEIVEMTESEKGWVQEHPPDGQLNHQKLCPV